MVPMVSLVDWCRMNEPEDGRGETLVTTTLAASTVQALTTLVGADVALLLDALLVYWKKIPHALPGFRRLLIKS